MKSLRMPSAQGGELWILTHDLMHEDGRRRHLRPIHVFTWLAQRLPNNKPQDVFWLCLALENKLFAVRQFLFELRAAIARVGDPIYGTAFVRAYEDEQQVIAMLEAYLAAVYTALEIAAEINRLLHPNLRIGFREQAKKVPAFSFTEWKWLGHFYDLRSELTHFNTPLPSVERKNLLVEFRRAKRLHTFQPGRNEIQFEVILAYASELFRMLDTWASGELVGIDRAIKIKVTTERCFDGPLRVKEVTVGSILKLLVKRKRQRKGGVPN
jgi:hypothetical protein